jgi:hypothetical protein
VTNQAASSEWTSLEIVKLLVAFLTLCFFTWRGHFREIAPPRAIAIQRELDKTVYANQQLFSEERIRNGNPNGTGSS